MTWGVFEANEIGQAHYPLRQAIQTFRTLPEASDFAIKLVYTGKHPAVVVAKAFQEKEAWLAYSWGSRISINGGDLNYEDMEK